MLLFLSFLLLSLAPPSFLNSPPLKEFSSPSLHLESLWNQIVSICSTPETPSLLLELSVHIQQMGDSFQTFSHQKNIDLLELCEKQKNDAMYHLLVKNRVDLNKVDSIGNTPFVRAIFWGRLDRVSSLLEFNVNLSLPANIGTPLSRMCMETGHVLPQFSFIRFIFLRYILAQGIDLNGQFESIRPVSIEWSHRVHLNFFTHQEDVGDIAEQSPLRRAILLIFYRRHFNTFQLLEQYGANIFQKDFDGNNFLHHLSSSYSQLFQSPFNRHFKQKLKSLSRFQSAFQTYHFFMTYEQNGIDVDDFYIFENREYDYFLSSLNSLWKSLTEKGLDPYLPNLQGETPEQLRWKHFIQKISFSDFRFSRIKTIRQLATNRFLNHEGQTLSFLSSLPLNNFLARFQSEFPFPYDKQMGASLILWNLRDLVVQKVLQERPFPEPFLNQYMQQTLSSNMMLRPTSESEISTHSFQQAVPLDILFLVAHGLKFHPHPLVFSFFKDLLKLMLKKNENGLFIYDHLMTPTSREYLYFFNEDSIKEGQFHLNIEYIHQKWSENHPCILPWALFMTVEEALLLARYDFNSDRQTSLYFPISFSSRLTESSIERLTMKNFTSHLCQQSDNFNQQVINQRLTHLEEISTLDQLYRKIQDILSPNQYDQIKQTFTHQMSDLEWISHGRSLVLGSVFSSDSDSNSPSFYCEISIKFRKKDESSRDFSDYEVLKVLKEKGGWNDLRPLAQLKITDPLKTQLETYINEHQFDSHEQFEIEGECFLYESKQPYFTYLNQVSDKKDFLESLENNIRQTLKMYRHGYIRNELSCSQHDNSPNNPRKTLYYTPSWGCTFSMFSRGVVDNRNSFLDLSNFGLSIRDPGNYVRSSSELKDKKDDLISSNLIYQFPDEDFVHNFLMDALIELIDIAFEHYIHYYVKNPSSMDTELMSDEIIDTIILPLLQENCPFIPIDLWDGWIYEIRPFIQLDMKLLIQHAPHIDFAIQRRITREHLFQNVMIAVNRCYSLISTYFNDPEGLTSVLQKKKDRPLPPLYPPFIFHRPTERTEELIWINDTLTDSNLVQKIQHHIDTHYQENTVSPIWLILLHQGEEKVLFLLDQIHRPDLYFWSFLIYSFIVTDRRVLFDFCLHKIQEFDTLPIYIHLLRQLFSSVYTDEKHSFFEQQLSYSLNEILKLLNKKQQLSLIDDVLPKDLVPLLYFLCTLSDATYLIQHVAQKITLLKIKCSSILSFFYYSIHRGEDNFLTFIDSLLQAGYNLWAIDTLFNLVIHYRYLKAFRFLIRNNLIDYQESFKYILKNKTPNVQLGSSSDISPFLSQLFTSYKYRTFLIDYCNRKYEEVLSACLYNHNIVTLEFLLQSNIFVVGKKLSSDLLLLIKDIDILQKLCRYGFKISTSDIRLDPFIIQENWVITQFLLELHDSNKHLDFINFQGHITHYQRLLLLCSKNTQNETHWTKKEGVLLIEKMSLPIEQLMNPFLLSSFILNKDEKMLDYFFQKKQACYTSDLQKYIQEKALYDAIDHHTPLHIIEKLLECIDLNSPFYLNIFSKIAFSNRMDKVSLFETFIKKGLDYRPEEIAQIAILKNDSLLLTWLLEKGLNPDAQMTLSSYYTPLTDSLLACSIHLSHFQLIAILLQYQATQVSKKQLLDKVFKHQTSKDIQILLENSYFLDFIQSEASLFLILLAKSSDFPSTSFCQILVQKNFFQAHIISTHHFDNDNVLFLALRNRKYEYARTLLENGCPYLMCDKNGKTVLHCLLKPLKKNDLNTSRSQWIELFYLFIEKGVDSTGIEDLLPDFLKKQMVPRIHEINQRIKTRRSPSSLNWSQSFTSRSFYTPPLFLQFC